MMTKLIVNADDFGLCTGVNKAVLKAHTEGVLSSATLMANMPAADEAVQMSKNLPKLGVGVHLNLLEGKPVSDAKEVEILLDKQGNFMFSPLQLALRSMLSSKIREAMEIEMAEQIQWVQSRGIRPTHLDSHKHFHCFGAIYPIVCRLAQRFDIDAIRWPFEPATVCTGHWPKVSGKDRRRALIVRTMAKLNRRHESRFIRNDLFLGLAHTGRIDGQFWAELGETQLAGVVEIMTHPGYTQGLDSSRTRLVEQRETELKWLCSQETKNHLAQAGFELVHYGQLDKD